MAATVLVSVEGVGSRRRSGKPRILLRGQRRKAANKALAALKHLENQEFFEGRRSAANSYDPFLILGAGNSRYNTAVTLLKTRLEEALSAKA